MAAVVVIYKPVYSNLPSELFIHAIGLRRKKIFVTRASNLKTRDLHYASLKIKEEYMVFFSGEKWDHIFFKSIPFQKKLSCDEIRKMLESGDMKVEYSSSFDVKNGAKKVVNLVCKPYNRNDHCPLTAVLTPRILKAITSTAETS